MCFSRILSTPIIRRNQPGKTFESVLANSLQHFCWTLVGHKRWHCICLAVSLWGCLSMEPSCQAMRKPRAQGEVYMERHKAVVLSPGCTSSQQPAPTWQSPESHLGSRCLCQLLGHPSWCCVEQRWSFSAKSVVNCGFVGKINSYWCFKSLSFRMAY